MRLCPRPLSVIGAVLLTAIPCLLQAATYRLTIENTWSESSHPGAFPEDAHFSWLGGGTHSPLISLWSEGALASPGIVEMAETGATFQLVTEVEAAITAGDASAILDWQHWFCPTGTTHPNCGPLVVQFEVDEAFPSVTLVTMLGPSPDWFVGVSGLMLHDGIDWIDSITVDLRPHDGGTREQNIFELGGPLTTPQVPISLITAASGQLVGPASLGTFRFERVLMPSVPMLGSGAMWILSVALLAIIGGRLASRA